jgi:hypothetical protein
MLVSLAKGRLGTETATLTEALLVAGFWQAALGRVQVAPARRRPFFLYADEFQDVIRLSESHRPGRSGGPGPAARGYVR